MMLAVMSMTSVVYRSSDHPHEKTKAHFLLLRDSHAGVLYMSYYCCM